ncbi:HEAT repeat domain-containing protein [Paludisphaera mucosa]|uniref:HEAT repeat domain-containing protein n=1 Tax=Paludisphaera mucosa TaxID=3030827 RepID=A0ABT6FLA8_9BACT|nr:HEAT repeat domain-containing protein [Paludisphaera mucosa]MDG3008360.1 HEAT repeat domain-containing protein [Paludisphaera mucosa]
MAAFTVVPAVRPSAQEPVKPATPAPGGGLTQEREIDVVPSQLNLGDDLKAMVATDLGVDPAEWTHFRVALDRVSRRFDTRSDAEVIKAMGVGNSSTLREQAVFEYADRHREKAVPGLLRAYQNEADPRVRIDALWAAAKFGGTNAVGFVKTALEDSNIEVREWASIFHEELGVGVVGFGSRKVRGYAGRVFDQSIPLHILCNVYVKTPLKTWVKVVLSPLKIEEVFGKCHANTTVASREHRMVMTKRIKNYYTDGAPHYETFRFHGLTERTNPNTANFAFVSTEKRPFFVSGQIGNTSAGVMDGDVNFVRVGQWKLDPNIPVRDDFAIRYVKGNFLSWGYVSMAQLLDDDDGDGSTLDRGEFLRAVVADDDKGEYCNAFVSGTWKGKMTDEDGDGILDLNLPETICTAAGWLDLDHDGKADEPRATTTAYRTINRGQGAPNVPNDGRVVDVGPSRGREITGGAR